MKQVMRVKEPKDVRQELSGWGAHSFRLPQWERNAINKTKYTTFNIC